MNLPRYYACPVFSVLKHSFIANLKIFYSLTNLLSSASYLLLSPTYLPSICMHALYEALYLASKLLNYVVIYVHM